MRRITACAALEMCLFGVVAWGAPAAVIATHAPEAPRIDGAVDDAAWAAAPVFDAFVQSFPNEGAAPSERTELRVLYDHRHLYVAVRAYDTHPDAIVRTLGRRDNPPASDLVTVVLDSTLDRRTGYAFTINAAGVIRDGIYTNDKQFSTDWDGVWDAAAVVGRDGWSAELAIPLSLLRFSAGGERVWGFHVRRELPRTHELIDTAVIPSSGGQFVSRFIDLRGLDSLEPHRKLEIVPYAAARAARAPRYGEPERPSPRLWIPSADVGLDLRSGLSSDLALTATVNPDFGQVEADRVVLNLSNTELFFPEKRPFFTQGMDLFVPVGADDTGRAPQMLFYSRRIGLLTPILGAAKVVGSVGGNTEIGVLDAVVTDAPPLPAPESPEDPPPDRRFRYHVARPLHFGIAHDAPDEEPVARNFFVGVARRRFGASRVGLRLIDATPLSNACRCDPEGGRAVGIDWDLRTRDRAWGTWGQLTGSHVYGAGEPRVLRDGTQIAPGDLGYGTYLRAGKLGGEPVRAFIHYEYSSPRLELNHGGFIGTQNDMLVWAEAQFVRSQWGAARDAWAGVWGVSEWTTDGRGIPRYRSIGAFAEATLPALWFTKVGGNVSFDDGQYDVREIPEQGIPYRKAPNFNVGAAFKTDPTRPVWMRLGGFAFQNLPQGVLVGRLGYGGSLDLTARPIPALETTLAAILERPALTARFLDRVDADTLRFGGLLATQMSITLRQQVVITRELTLQAYAQLFAANGHFEPFYEGDYSGGRLEMTDLRLASDYAADYDFRESALALNVVLRWEYRLGSTLYAVYTRSQQNLPFEGVSPPGMAGLTLRGLGQGPATDTFLLKWTWYWDASS
jgi:hypothetical protein